VNSDATEPQRERDRGQDDAPGQPGEEELRAAYEQELSRITSADLALQAAVSLLNIGGRRLGLSAASGESAEGERDLEQVRDAIDGVRGLLVVLERRRPNELRPLRDALSQLQLAYAREARASAPGAQPGSSGEPAGQTGTGEGKDAPQETERPRAPGPAESSGRLWVPGR
jgi:hypothetical protein